jgi:subtilisin family serine protease
MRTNVSPALQGRLRSGLYAILLGLGSAAATAQAVDSQATHPFAQSQPVPGRYIVVFKRDVGNPAAEAANHVRDAGGQLHHVYSTALKGFAATLPEAALAGIRNNPLVDYIEQDQTVSLTQMESGATWGLDRIDQADRPLDLMYHYNATGAGVNAFIIDTGIRPDHVEFSGRLSAGYTAISDGRGTTDCNGHGTHVAGTVGGTTWGVAKQVALTPVRVLDCRGSGTWSGVIAGIDWVASTTPRPAVANMSLGGGKSASVNAAVAGAVAKGVTMVVAAGNSNADACNYSPSSESSALTVGATTNSDIRASYSNYGPCVDLFAPGSAITSAWNTGSSATNTISGTSMASPHVAGVSALVAQTNPGASPAAIASFLADTSTANKLGSIGTGSPNLLVYSLGTGSAAEPPASQIAVSGLTGSWSRQGKNWRAKATAMVHDVITKAAMANVTVTGGFAPGGNASCVTASNGSCTLSSAPISSTTTASVFTVGELAGSNMIYEADQNSASGITIIKP